MLSTLVGRAGSRRGGFILEEQATCHVISAHSPVDGAFGCFGHLADAIWIFLVIIMTISIAKRDRRASVPSTGGGVEVARRSRGLAGLLESFAAEDTTMLAGFHRSQVRNEGRHDEGGCNILASSEFLSFWPQQKFCSGTARRTWPSLS
ncbi:hypothetical protein BDW62DRAFT_187234 [Aspergillus aurantiobrunneus]